MAETPLQTLGAVHLPVGNAHRVPLASNLSIGHFAVTPSQYSATSQFDDLSRQITFESLILFGGHALLEPEHIEGKSHSPVANRQVFPALKVINASSGHNAEVPEL